MTSRSVKDNTSKDKEIERMGVSDIPARWCIFSKGTVEVRIGKKVVGRAMLIIDSLLGNLQSSLKKYTDIEQVLLNMIRVIIYNSC